MFFQSLFGKILYMDSDSAVDHPPLTAITPRQKSILPDELCGVFLDCLSDPPISDSLKLEKPFENVYYIDNVLSIQECEEIIKLIDSSNMLSFWCLDKENDSEVKSYRNAETIEMQSESFANKIWERVVHLFDNNFNITINDDEDDEQFERDMVGVWEPQGLNPYSLFAKYPKFGSFAPHTDGRAIIDFNHRSHYSVVIYFNSVPKDCGAGTRFYEEGATNVLQKLSKHDHEYWTADSSLVTFEVEAKAGRMVIFHQSLVHEGVPPINDYLKYILRSDIIFQRTPPICDSPVDIEAYRLFREAENLAESGELESSLTLFKKAFRMSPLFARIMGQG